MVDDDTALAEMLGIVLRGEGFDPVFCADGSGALEAFRSTRPDLVLLDLMLPGKDGIEVCRQIRSESGTPIVMLTAKGDTVDVVLGLESGADDYVVKPFTTEQLEARIRAVMRRAGGRRDQGGDLEVGGLRIDQRGRRVQLDGSPVDLTPKEFDLLLFLAERADEVVTKRELLTEVWHQPWGGSDKTVDVHLSWLRRKLGETASEPRFLHTVRGVGVRLSAPPAPAASAGSEV